MADGGPRLVAAYPTTLSNYSSPRYHYLPQSSEYSYSRRKPSLASLSLYDLPSANMASSSVSPTTIKSEFGGVGTGIAYGAPPPPPPSAAVAQALPHGEKSNPLSFIKTFTDKKLTRDGQPAKRRGPKPDSKPALTRRQELNRQAQRTHRERKELYIKALEDEVLRLKEIYSNVSQDKERLAEENRSLKGMLQQNGLSISPGTAMMDDNISNPSVGPYIGSNSSASGSGSYAPQSASTQNTSYTPPPGSALSTTGAMPRGLSPPGGLSPGNQAAALHRHSPTGHAPGPLRNPAVDYDQAGIDFVLTLERPCMDHMPWLLERSSANGGLEPCGHALMASCPPEPFPELTADIPFGHKHGNHLAALNGNPGQQQQQQQQQHPLSANSRINNVNSNSNSNSNSASANAGVSRNFSRNGASPVNGMRANGNPPPSASMAMDVDRDPPPRTWELSKADLTTLLDLSQKLNLDGEITPVMSWGMVLGHPRLGELNEKDFARLSEELRSKVRCYGFGAVMEEFEVRDALEAILSTKPEPLGGNGIGF